MCSCPWADPLPEVLVDGGQIQHVILNFVRNSLEALSSRAEVAGQLMIRTSVAEKGDVELAVIDSLCSPSTPR